MTDKFKVKYQVADGYAGGARPQSFTVGTGWIEDDMTDQDLANALDELIQEDFEQRISWSGINYDDVLEWAKSKRDEMAGDDA